jgi:hypothetical protein
VLLGGATAEIPKHQQTPEDFLLYLPRWRNIPFAIAWLRISVKETAIDKMRTG